MEYKESTDKKINVRQMNDLRESVGWMERNERTWEEILSKSSFVYSLWDGEKLIGMGRFLEDSMMCIFYDVAVRKEYQGIGLGKKIMKKMISEARDRGCLSIRLFVDEQNAESLILFYEKLGFGLIETGMKYKLI